MSSARSLFLLSLFLFFTAAKSYAKHYVVGVEELEYYPIYAQREGEYAGFARELLDGFATSNGHTFEYRHMPIKRLFNDFIAGKFDFKFPDSSQWQTAMKKGKAITYSDPVLEYIDGVMVATSELGKGKSHLKTLGVPRGFTPWEYLEDAKNKQISITEGNSLKNLVKMAQTKRIDGVYFNIIVAKYFLEHTEFASNIIVFDKTLPHTRSTYHLSSIKHPNIIQEFNHYLKANVAKVEALKAKYNVTLN